MGKLLHILGSAAFRRRWAVVAVWLVILVGLGAAAAHYMKPTGSSISIPGTSAQKTLDRFNQLFPETGAQSGRIVVAVPAGKSVDDYKAQISSLTSEVAKVPEIGAAISPFDNPSAISQDKSTAYITVQVKPEDKMISKEHVEAVEATVAKARTGGLQVEIGGDIANTVPSEIIGVGEIIGVIMALVVLLATFGSFIAAGMPILVALVTVALSMTGLFALSEAIDINSTTPALAVMLGLAVGIDYSLFIINRYRAFVHEGYQLEEAAGRAVATAGNAVIFAAATVVIALAALSVVRIPFMTTMGLSAAATVATAALVAITFIPAILGFAGLKVFAKKNRQDVARQQASNKVIGEHIDRKSFWYGWGTTLLRFRLPILLAAIALIAVLAMPVRSITLGLPTDETAAADTTQRRAYDLLSRGFGAGFNGPLLVVVEGLPAVSEADKAAVRQQVMAAYEQTVASETVRANTQYQQMMAAVTTPEARAALQQQAAAMQGQAAAKQAAGLAEVEKQVAKLAPYYGLSRVAGQISKVDNVKQATPALVTDNGTKGVLQVIPAAGPSDGKTKDLVAYLRDKANQPTLTGSTAATMGVTGSTAMQIDVNGKLAQALPTYLVVVVGLSLVLLMVAFRSILIPIKATLGFLLSVAAMFGSLVAVFQWDWLGIAAAPGPIVSFIPIIGIGILFGLAMDYEFFLVSGMQEAYHDKRSRQDAQLAIIRGFSLGSKVVVAAGLIMVAVFAGFVSSHDNTIQAIGFALAVGILIDAFIVRLIIVPILMSYLGRAAWWLPRWLDKALPNISIEGESAPDQPSRKG